jgi:hypothetical protein
MMVVIEEYLAWVATISVLEEVALLLAGRKKGLC